MLCYNHAQLVDNNKINHFNNLRLLFPSLCQKSEFRKSQLNADTDENSKIYKGNLNSILTSFHWHLEIQARFLKSALK